MRLKYTHLTGHLGVEVSLIDLTKKIDEDTYKELLALWSEHELLVFRDQQLETADFVALCSLFGKLEDNYFFFQPQSEQFPQVSTVIKEAGEPSNSGGIWHHDQAYYAEPVKGICLYSVELPSKGGDTLFSSSTLAYEKLSPAMKTVLGTLNVIHTTEIMLNKKSQLTLSKESGVGRAFESMPLATAIHPAVCVNPDTGRPFLYMNRTTTSQFEGMSRDESAGLLQYLYQHIEKPEFNCRVHWQPGTLVLWNNHQLLHYAVNDYNERREMHRVHFAAEKPQKYR